MYSQLVSVVGFLVFFFVLAMCFLSDKQPDRGSSGDRHRLFSFLG